MTDTKNTPLAPGFIVASPAMADPFFKKTVIFLIEHENEEGTFGVIINKPSLITLNEVFLQLGLSKPSVTCKVLQGGPVDPELGWVIHSTDWSSQNTKKINNVGITASIEIIKAIKNQEGPGQYCLCLGYSGWGEKQLVQEILAGSWLHVPFSEDLLFDIEIEDRWEKAISKLGINPSYISPQTGGA